jgi:hypothetical protein
MGSGVGWWIEGGAVWTTDVIPHLCRLNHVCKGVLRDSSHHPMHKPHPYGTVQMPNWTCMVDRKGEEWVCREKCVGSGVEGRREVHSCLAHRRNTSIIHWHGDQVSRT